MDHYDVALWLQDRSSFPEYVQVVQAGDWVTAIEDVMRAHDLVRVARASVACVVAASPDLDIERAAVRLPGWSVVRYGRGRLTEEGLQAERLIEEDADPQVNRSAQNTWLIA